MASVPIRPTPTPATAERRGHPRKRLDQLAYIGLGPDIGGVLLDISEEGLRCQIVGSVIEGDTCHLKFALPGRRSAIEVDGEVVWSNSSKQGGGVRLVGLCPDVRQDLQQWISDEMTAGGVKRPPPTPIRTKRVGAALVPKHSAPKPAVPAPAAKEAPASPPRQLYPPVHLIPKAVAEAQQSTLHATPKTAVAQKPAPRPKKPHQEPLTVSHVEHRIPRFAKIAALAGCVAAGVAAFAFSKISPARLLSDREIPPYIASGRITPPAPPPMNASIPPATAAQPDESARPTVAGDAADHDSRGAGQIASPEAPIAHPAPANRLPQDPRTAEPLNRQRLALAPPRPRATNPAPPAVAAMEAPVAPLALPAPLLDVPMLESRSPELAQPVRPPTGSDYRQPQLLSRVEPVYSAFARQARLQGTVRVNSTIGTDGVPRSSVCVDGNTVLCRMALEAIAKWRYQPATSNGQPVEAQTLITFNFQLR